VYARHDDDPADVKQKEGKRFEPACVAFDAGKREWQNPFTPYPLFGTSCHGINLDLSIVRCMCIRPFMSSLQR